MGTATRMERERVDPLAFREHLINAILIAGTLGIVTFMCCAATVTYEIITARVQLIATLSDLQRAENARADSVFWRLDTFLRDFRAANLSLANGLNNVRVQVRQSQVAQTQQAHDIARVATNVATASLKATQGVIEAVVEKPSPVVEVKPPAPTVEVRQSPPPVVVERKKEEPQPKPVKAEPPPKKKRWFRYVWPF